MERLLEEEYYESGIIDRRFKSRKGLNYQPKSLLYWTVATTFRHVRWLGRQSTARGTGGQWRPLLQMIVAEYGTCTTSRKAGHLLTALATPSPLHTSFCLSGSSSSIVPRIDLLLNLQEWQSSILRLNTTLRIH